MTSLTLSLLGRPVTRVALAASSGFLLGLSFLYPAFYVLAWGALVPLLFAFRHCTVTHGYWIGVVHGLVLFPIGSYWLIHFGMNTQGFSAVVASAAAAGYWLYCAQATGIAGALFCWLQRRSSVPAVIAFPILTGATLAGFPFLFPVDIGQTQTRFILALQGLDITGVLGLNLVLLLANAVCYQCLVGFTENRRRLSLSLAVGLILAWMSYGVFSLISWSNQSSEWPRLTVGLVQSNAPPSLERPAPAVGFSYAYPPEMALYRSLAEQGAELVIWPELRHTGYYEHAYVRAAFNFYVHADGAALLFQDIAPGKKTHNTATLITRDTKEHAYHKVRLIPFGESVPGPDWLEMNQRLTKYLFGKFYSPLRPGDQRIVLPFAGAALLPLICYEVAFPEFVAKGVEVDGQRAQLIVVQSNDVWFGRSHQPEMHQQIALLRSVENRLPLIHVINNGPSAVISPTGEVIFKSEPHVQGGYLLEIARPERSGRTVFNLYPDMPARVVFLLAAGLLLLGVSRKYTP